jgi:hypothetical protein
VVICRRVNGCSVSWQSALLLVRYVDNYSRASDATSYCCRLLYIGLHKNVINIKTNTTT